MHNHSHYVSSSEAIGILRIKRETFYTYVGRGWIRRLSEGRGKRTLYLKEDIERLRVKSEARSGHAAAAAAALRWGPPVLESSITELTPRGPKYRGHSALELAKIGMSFESVAELLCRGALPAATATWDQKTYSDERFVPVLRESSRGFQIFDKLFSVNLQMRMAHSRRASREDAEDLDSMRRLICTFIGCLGYLSPSPHYVEKRERESLAAHVVRAAQLPETSATVDMINALLIVCADHELSPPSLAARVAASAGADYHACIGAALYAQSGKSLGGLCHDVERLLLDCENRRGFGRQLAQWRRERQNIPGFNHPFYPTGDPRALYLLDLVKSYRANGKTGLLLELIGEAAQQHDATPSLAVGLVAACHAVGLPRQSAAALWTIGWTAGWSAHVIEQRAAGYLLRPRARVPVFFSPASIKASLQDQ